MRRAGTQIELEWQEAPSVHPTVGRLHIVGRSEFIRHANRKVIRLVRRQSGQGHFELIEAVCPRFTLLAADMRGLAGEGLPPDDDFNFDVDRITIRLAQLEEEPRRADERARRTGANADVVVALIVGRIIAEEVMVADSGVP